MSTFKTFEEINSWQRARELTKEIYQLTLSGPFAKDFALRDQIRRASISIMANISEGFEREGNNEFIQFLSVAKASSTEFRSHLYVALDADYISKDQFEKLYTKAGSTGDLIGGLMRYLKESEMKGKKFANRGKLKKRGTRNAEPGTDGSDNFDS